jgi:hypothetical protein
VRVTDFCGEVDVAENFTSKTDEVSFALLKNALSLLGSRDKANSADHYVWDVLLYIFCQMNLKSKNSVSVNDGGI